MKQVSKQIENVGSLIGFINSKVMAINQKNALKRLEKDLMKENNCLIIKLKYICVFRGCFNDDYDSTFLKS